MASNEHIGRQVKRAREARGVSQAELANAIGVSLATLQRIETGQRPLTIPEAQQIAIHLRVTAWWWFGDETAMISYPDGQDVVFALDSGRQFLTESAAA